MSRRDPAPSGHGGGALTIVGTGYRMAGQLTAEARAAIAGADRLFYLVTDAATGAFLAALNPRARSLHTCYREGEPGRRAAGRMVARLLAALRRGHEVCAAFAGHPAVYLAPAHAALRRARRAGFPATMLPGVSCEDCLYADLGIDPGATGRVLFEATDFLLRRRRPDPATLLVLLQAGAVGVVPYRSGTGADRRGLALLAQRLREHYPAGHAVLLYEAGTLPPFEARVARVALADLEAAPVSVVTTLVLPPLAA
jgi:hypothetical protein